MPAAWPPVVRCVSPEITLGEGQPRCVPLHVVTALLSKAKTRFTLSQTKPDARRGGDGDV